MWSSTKKKTKSAKNNGSQKTSPETSEQSYPPLHNPKSFVFNSSTLDTRSEKEEIGEKVTTEGSRLETLQTTKKKRKRKTDPKEELNEPIETSPKQPYDNAERIKKLIQNLIDDPDEFIKKAMESDGENTAADQLRKCLEACKTFSAEDTALYLYTTYFYGPLNKYLRKLDLTTDSTPLPDMVKDLMNLTRDILMDAFKKGTKKDIGTRYRMDLRGDWIKNYKVNETISFLGFTSTHPDLNGINTMWGDIEDGRFGEMERPALLIFEGTSSMLFPQEGRKYFPDEVEGILPAGMEARVVATYPIQWKPKDKKSFDLTVFHLVTPSSASKVSVKKMGFDGDGSVKEVGTIFLD